MNGSENQENRLPWAENPNPPQPVSPEKTAFPTKLRELIFAAGILLCGLVLCNFTLWGGFNLGFSMAATAYILCMGGYLLSCQKKPSLYGISLLAVSLVICAGFARADDGFVKFVMLCFLFVSTNLGFCLLAQQNRHSAAGVCSLLDAPGCFFRLGFGKLPEAFRGLGQAFRRSGPAGQRSGAVLLGLAIAVPILAIVIPLLISADAAFEGLMALLPDFDLAELLVTVLFGFCTAAVLYTQGTALHHAPRAAETARRGEKGLSTLTVNTVLGAVCAVYGVYLFSQLAYITGGFAGILPKEYTAAEYARRGFFEMAWLCAINLGLTALLLGVSKKRPAHLSTRLLCLFLALVTLFLVASASGKMFLYIGSFGLTRLRVLTQIIMLFLALATVFVCLWLFIPKLPYMKAVLLSALLIGAAVLWADVDTQVAHYNVNAYLSGQLETVDVNYLTTLGEGAVPALAQLSQEATDASVQTRAEKALQKWHIKSTEDFRQWNYANHAAIKHSLLDG